MLRRGGQQSIDWAAETQATCGARGKEQYMPMTNRGNRCIYQLWAPVYDAIFGRLYAAGRRQTAASLAVRAGQRVLLPGVGTGADLPLLPEGTCAIGVDLSRAMLAQAQARLPLPSRAVVLICGDVQALPLGDGTCDAGLLTLIVSVAPDGAACVREAARVVRPGGPIMIFDKFLPDHARLGIGRRLLNVLARRIGTDINRRLSDLLAGSGCVVVDDRPSLFGGAYRAVVVQTANSLPARLTR
jgi:phosphatidylethanolamine/phosphatidyl-N-methylethanolamine N-methyltransferase